MGIVCEPVRRSHTSSSQEQEPPRSLAREAPGGWASTRHAGGNLFAAGSLTLPELKEQRANEHARRWCAGGGLLDQIDGRLCAALADGLNRSATRLHPRSQSAEPIERRDRALCVLSCGQMLAQDALSGRIDVLVVACRVPAQPPERLRTKVYLSGHRSHRTSKSKGAFLPRECGGAGGDNGARI